MLEALFGQYRSHLDHFFRYLDFERTRDIFHLFLTCRGKIIFTGLGKSGIVAKKLASTMISTGISSTYLSPANGLHGDIGVVTSDDLTVCLSKSGESQELLDLVTCVKKRGSQVVAWVSNPSCRLMRVSDAGIYLPVIKELCPFNLAPTTSAVVQLIFGDVVTVALMKAKKFSLSDYALNHPAGSIGKKTAIYVRDLMLVDQRLPLCHLDQLLSDAIVEFTRKRCGCLLITDGEGHLKGIFTDGDLRRAIARDGTEVFNRPMCDLMTSPFLAINKNLLAWQALAVMQKNPDKRVMMLPVLEGKQLVGLIHMHDIVQLGIS